MRLTYQGQAAGAPLAAASYHITLYHIIGQAAGAPLAATDTGIERDLGEGQVGMCVCVYVLVYDIYVDMQADVSIHACMHEFTPTHTMHMYRCIVYTCSEQ